MFIRIDWISSVFILNFILVDWALLKFFMRSRVYLFIKISNKYKNVFRFWLKMPTENKTFIRASKCIFVAAKTQHMLLSFLLLFGASFLISKCCSTILLNLILYQMHEWSVHILLIVWNKSKWHWAVCHLYAHRAAFINEKWYTAVINDKKIAAEEVSGRSKGLTV